MKKQFKSVRLLTLAICSLFIFGSASINNASCETPKQFSQCLNFSYDWGTHSNASSYTLEITNQTTQEVFTWTTNETIVNAFGVPSGTYSLKLIGHHSSSSSFIITEDTIQH